MGLPPSRRRPLGLYLSASGVLANNYNVDVLANNLANSESIGFKRDMTLFRQRLTAAQESHKAGDWTDPILEKMGGGLAVNPTMIDSSQGELETTGNPLDLAIQGKGYFAVQDANGIHLTRDGRFMLNSSGELVMSNSRASKVLDATQRPIVLDSTQLAQIGPDGKITQDGAPAGTIGLFNVPNPQQLTKNGANQLNYPNVANLMPADGMVRSESVERSNVDPTTELAQLMEAQRDLEANANMIHYQDETLQSLVQDVGKIG
jgi:flagellar basal-body rod protein FlgF